MFWDDKRRSVSAHIFLGLRKIGDDMCKDLAAVSGGTASLQAPPETLKGSLSMCEPFDPFAGLPRRSRAAIAADFYAAVPRVGKELRIVEGFLQRKSTSFCFQRRHEI